VTVTNLVRIVTVTNFLLGFGSTLLPDAVAADALDATETSLAAAVDRRSGEALELLQQAIDINSDTMNFDGVRRVGELFSTEFDELEFETTWEAGEAYGRAGHLIAVRKRGGLRVLLIGHLDTVFAKDSPFQRYERVDEYSARGPGITDMKGGNVVMLEALRALDDAGLLDELSVTVVLTGDEESSGEPLALARKSLIDAATWADVAIGFEDGDGNPETAVVARRGSLDWELTVTGKAAHSSQIFQPDYGYGAIYEAARILNAFRERLSRQELLTVNPGMVAGGDAVSYDPAAGASATGKYNIVAQTLRAGGDLRTISPEQLESAREEMEAIVAGHLPHTDARIAFGEGYPPMAKSDGNLALLAMFDEASRDLGFGPVRAVDPRDAGAADISFAAAQVQMAIDGVGMMGSGGHTVDELADLRTLPMNAKRVAVLLYRLTRDSPVQ
jgi:glutamate carboxypeptidase